MYLPYKIDLNHMTLTITTDQILKQN